MATTTTSKKFTLNKKDFVKGLAITVISAVLTTLLPLVSEGDFSFNWKPIVGVALTTGISYLLKNLFSPAEIVITNPAPEAMQAVKDGTAQVNIETKPS